MTKEMGPIRSEFLYPSLVKYIRNSFHKKPNENEIVQKHIQHNPPEVKYRQLQRNLDIDKKR